MRVDRIDRIDRIDDRDDFFIVIDDGDGTPPQTLSVVREDFFNVAWVLWKSEDWKVLRTLTWIGHFHSEEEQEVELRIPRWARSQLSYQVRKKAVSAGWKGEVYRRNGDVRLPRDPYDVRAHRTLN